MAAHDENDQNIVYDRFPAKSVTTEINKYGLKNGRVNGTAQRRESSSVLIVLPSGKAEIINGRGNVTPQRKELCADRSSGW